MSTLLLATERRMVNSWASTAATLHQPISLPSGGLGVEALAGSVKSGKRLNRSEAGHVLTILNMRKTKVTARSDKLRENWQHYDSSAGSEKVRFLAVQARVIWLTT